MIGDQIQYPPILCQLSGHVQPSVNLEPWHSPDVECRDTEDLLLTFPDCHHLIDINDEQMTPLIHFLMNSLLLGSRSSHISIYRRGHKPHNYNKTQAVSSCDRWNFNFLIRIENYLTLLFKTLSQLELLVRNQEICKTFYKMFCACWSYLFAEFILYRSVDSVYHYLQT